MRSGFSITRHSNYVMLNSSKYWCILCAHVIEHSLLRGFATPDHFYYRYRLFACSNWSSHLCHSTPSQTISYFLSRQSRKSTSPTNGNYCTIGTVTWTYTLNYIHRNGIDAVHPIIHAFIISDFNFWINRTLLRSSCTFKFANEDRQILSKVESDWRHMKWSAIGKGTFLRQFAVFRYLYVCIVQWFKFEKKKKRLTSRVMSLPLKKIWSFFIVLPALSVNA